MDIKPTSSGPKKKLQWLRSQIIGSGADFRSPFGRRRITYADTTASGQSLLYIENYILRHVLPFYGNTHTSESYVGNRTTKMVKEATSYIKRCLGGGDDDAIVFCGSGSTAAIKRLQEVMGIAVPETLRDRVVLREEERWLVFVGPYEHHSNLLSWRRSLAEVVEIGLTADGEIDVEDLRAQLQRYKDYNRPMMGSFSACSNVTGICSDTRAIATLLHQYGAFACFDFAASGPHVEISMKSGEMDGYDAIFLSPHKFLGGPGSPGILLMNKALYLITSTCPSTCGGGTVSYVNGFSEEDTLYHEDIEERENAGTPPITQTIRAALAFWVKDYIGQSTIEDRERNYIQTALTRLPQNENIEILGSASDVPRQAILSFLVYPNKRYWNWKEAQAQEARKPRPLHGPFVAKLLNDLFGIQARGGCACAGPYAHSLLKVDVQSSLAIRSCIQKGYHGVKPGWTRISFPFYLSNDEFELILDAVEFVANYGQRFLPLYHFDWKTGSWAFKSSHWVSQVLPTFFKCSKHDTDINNKNRKRRNAPKLTPFLIDLVSNSLKELDLKGSEFTTETIDAKTMNGEISDEDWAEMAHSHKLYMEIAMYLAALLPKFPEHRKAPKDLDFHLLFTV